MNDIQNYKVNHKLIGSDILKQLEILKSEFNHLTTQYPVITNEKQ